MKFFFSFQKFPVRVLTKVLQKPFIIVIFEVFVIFKFQFYINDLGKSKFNELPIIYNDNSIDFVTSSSHYFSRMVWDVQGKYKFEI